MQEPRTSLVDLLRRRAAEDPGRAAFTFLADGEREAARLSRGELDRAARAVGAAGGAQILKSSTLREMQRPHWVEPDWAAGWGLGFRIQRQNGKTYVGHGGALRGYRTQLQLCPAERIGVIVLTNADDGEPVKYADKAFAWVGPPILKATTPAAGAAPAGW